MYSVGFPTETISKKKVLQIYVLMHVLLMHCMWRIQSVSEVYLQYIAELNIFTALRGAQVQDNNKQDNNEPKKI